MTCLYWPQTIVWGAFNTAIRRIVGPIQVIDCHCTDDVFIDFASEIS
jgi:hypothetical protein